MSTKRIVTLLLLATLILAIGLAVMSRVGEVLVDWLWFSSVGYGSVFWTMLGAKAVLFAGAFLLSAGFFWVNGALALRLSGRTRPSPPADINPPSIPAHTTSELLAQMRPHVPWGIVVGAGAGVLGLLVATGETSNWDVFLQFLYHVPYGESDPVYGKDIAFYLFSLPAYVAVKNWMLTTLVVG